MWAEKGLFYGFMGRFVVWFRVIPIVLGILSWVYDVRGRGLLAYSMLVGRKYVMT